MVKLKITIPEYSAPEPLSDGAEEAETSNRLL